MLAKEIPFNRQLQPEINTTVIPETPQQIKKIVESLQLRSTFLMHQGVEKVARALLTATENLLDRESVLGRSLRQDLLRDSGLSEAMIEWGLRTTLGSTSYESMVKTAQISQHHQRCMRVPPRLVVTVLAGNVFTVGYRAILLPLLASAPVLVKVSSNDDALPVYLKKALDEANQELGECCCVIRFASGDQERQEALFEKADVVSLYSSDETVRSVRGQIPATSRLLVHGHGLGAIYIPATSLRNRRQANRLAEHAALDIAAYDQRGCLSPHVICIEKGGGITGEHFAELLAQQGLSSLSTSLPRCEMSSTALSQQMQWRGVAKVRGTLHVGQDWAVAYEGNEPLRPSPGYRNVGVYDCMNLLSAVEKLNPFGVHLKALGVSGSADNRKRVALALKAPLAPRICKVGMMQQPPFNALADGEQPLIGMVRWIEY